MPISSTYLTAADADESDEEVGLEERVIGITYGGQSLAFPLSAMAARTVANETFDRAHVAITWWPVTYSARAFIADSRAHGVISLEQGRQMVLNSSVLNDQAGVRHLEFIGQVLEGDTAGDRLEQVPVVATNWRAWREAHPDTEVMSKRGTPQLDPFESYYANDRSGLFRQPPKDQRWHGKDTVFGLVIGESAMAYPHAGMMDSPLIQEELGGAPVLVAHERISATIVAFDPTVDGRVLTFSGHSRNAMRPSVADGETFDPSRINYEPWLLKDAETGSLWRAISGECVEGELAGSRLRMLPGQTGFWFAWSRFYPSTGVLPRPDSLGPVKQESRL